MNQLIKEQLLKSKIKFDLSDDIYIERVYKIDPNIMKAGSAYEFIVKDAVNSAKPGRYYGDVQQIYEDLIKVNAVSVDGTERYFGWLPFDKIEVIQKI